MVKSFQDLNAWQEAHKLALKVYKISDKFPTKEQFGLTSQIRRCAVSVPSNIAEGFNRISLKEKIHFYSIAHGSVSELQSQLLLAKDIGYIAQGVSNKLYGDTETVHKILTGLIRSTRNR